MCRLEYRCVGSGHYIKHLVRSFKKWACNVVNEGQICGQTRKNHLDPYKNTSNFLENQYFFDRKKVLESSGSALSGSALSDLF